MHKRKRKIDLRRSERALLTDTLPYELPFFFTNANLAALSHAVLKEGKDHKFHASFLLTLGTRGIDTRPLHFEIRKNSTAFRRLSIPHPISQHGISCFYREHEEFIVNYCSRSTFSLRYASRVATHYVDKRYVAESEDPPTRRTPDEDPMGFRDQSKWASSYFSYRDYNLIYKFFDSDEFIGLEQRFTHLLKLDISRCFDSIYTHSIEWSMRGKSFAKRNLPNRDRKTFESSFDEAIRLANWNETHGILVGPEFSRIFAEILLQSADLAVRRQLESSGINVEIRRYVDDYFVFASNEEDADATRKMLVRALQQLNLHLNDAKTQLLTRPFISRTSAARWRVADCLELLFIVAQPMFVSGEALPTAARIERLRSQVIRAIRVASLELNTPYEEFASFGLAVLHRKLAAMTGPIEASPPVESGAHARLAWLTSVIRVGQFLYSMDRRVTTSLRLARLYTTVMSMCERMNCSVAPIKAQILDGLRNALTEQEFSTQDPIASINHICAIDLLLGSGARLTLHDVRKHIGVTEDPEGLKKCSYFQLMASLFISRRRHKFRSLKAAVVSEVTRRLIQTDIKFSEDTESALLLADFIACPHIDEKDRLSLLDAVYRRVTGENATTSTASAVLKSSGWISFTDWTSRADLSDMLSRKELTPAYE